MRRILLIGLLWLFAAPTAFAHGTAFFSITPEASRRFLAGTVEQPIIQPIIPPGDFISGIDLWIEYPLNAGNATIRFKDGNGTVLGERTVPLSENPPVWGGRQFHIDWDRSIPIRAGQEYSIEISDASGELGIYYFDRNELLGHTSPMYTPKTNETLVGKLRFGTRIEDISLKLALRELSESSPPVLTGVTINTPASRDTSISFYANELVDYRFSYGPAGSSEQETIPWTGSFHFCIEPIERCSIGFHPAPGTSYSYTLTAHDEWDNETNSTGSFVTPPEPEPPAPPPASPPVGEPPDTTPPVITNPRIIAIENGTVSVAWNTDEAADSRLVVRRGTETIASVTDPTHELEHFIISPPVLTDGTNYEALLVSYDTSGNASSESIPFATRVAEPTPASPPASPPVGGPLPPNNPSPSGLGLPTPAPIPGPHPAIEPPLPSLINAISGGTNINIRWTPSAEATDGYLVHIFDSRFALVDKRVVPSGTNEITSENLPAGTYSVIVYKDTGAAREKLGPSQTVTLGAPQELATTITKRDGLRRLAFVGGFILIFGIPLFMLIRRAMRAA